MSIQELLSNMPQVTKSNVLLTPTKDMPMILSQRFQKNGSNYRFLAPQSETTQMEGNSVKSKKILIRTSSSKTSIDQPKSKIIEDKVEKSGQNVSEQTELEYSPFKLQPNSSFNPSKLSPRQVKRLHPLTLAKYEAYSVPNADILSRVMKSECRAKSFLNEERLKYREKVKESKKKWNIIHCGYEDEDARKIGEKNAQKASERMKSKLHQIFSYRNSELKCLVEGQSSALEAIRLKEFLVPPPRLKLDKLFTEKDKLRLEELIANR